MLRALVMFFAVTVALIIVLAVAGVRVGYTEVLIMVALGTVAAVGLLYRDSRAG